MYACMCVCTMEKLEVVLSANWTLKSCKHLDLRGKACKQVNFMMLLFHIRM